MMSGKPKSKCIITLLLISFISIMLLFDETKYETIRAISTTADRQESVYEQTRYFEGSYLSYQSSMKEIGSQEEYVKKVRSEREYRHDSLSNFYESKYGTTSEINLYYNSNRGQIIPGALDEPSVTLSNVVNGGVTRENVTVTYDLMANPNSINKGAQYRIGNGEYCNFTSGTTFYTEGVYTIHLWNEIGHVYRGFTINRTFQFDEEEEWQFSINTHLTYTTRLIFRSEDNYITVKTLVEWDNLPANNYRALNLLFSTCLDEDFDNYNDFYGLYHRLETSFYYDEETVNEDGEILSSNYGQNESDNIALISNLVNSNATSGTISIENQPSSQIEYGLLYFSTNQPMPYDETVLGIGYLSSSIYYKRYTSAHYEMSARYVIQDPLATIGDYNSFDTTSSGDKVICVSSGLLFGGFDSDEIDIQSICGGLNTTTSIASLVFAPFLVAGTMFSIMSLFFLLGSLNFEPEMITSSTWDIASCVAGVVE